MTSEELSQLTRFFRKTFENQTLAVKARPRIADSAELYAGDEFLGIVTKIEDEGEVSYDLSMSILDFDLED
ncbi:DUF3126 family protein [Oricola cellulosilytica]|uniref:DUF3126 family protein n=1 Tax=Oricola cellulosilytica TaxID=1429082 RepID=A0A4V2MNU1_9HYPH|nr:DUF3126 family protein [Oricola cellulosilytica]TCD14577.1 DUF3126 family protein [Oricola cellulosilytica]